MAYDDFANNLARIELRITRPRLDIVVYAYKDDKYTELKRVDNILSENIKEIMGDIETTIQQEGTIYGIHIDYFMDGKFIYYEYQPIL